MIRGDYSWLLSYHRSEQCILTGQNADNIEGLIQKLQDFVMLLNSIAVIENICLFYQSTCCEIWAKNSSILLSTRCLISFYRNLLLVDVWINQTKIKIVLYDSPNLCPLRRSNGKMNNYTIKASKAIL